MLTALFWLSLPHLFSEKYQSVVRNLSLVWIFFYVCSIYTLKMDKWIKICVTQKVALECQIIAFIICIYFNSKFQVTWKKRTLNASNSDSQNSKKKKKSLKFQTSHSSLTGPPKMKLATNFFFLHYFINFTEIL